MIIESLQAEIEELAGAIADLQGQLKSLENPLPVAVGADLAEATAAHYESAEPRKRAVSQALATLQERLRAKQGELYQAQENERQTRLQSQIDEKLKEIESDAEEINFLAENLREKLKQSQAKNREIGGLWQEKLGRPHHNPPEFPKSYRDPLTGREFAPFTLPQAVARDSGIFLDQKPLFFS